LITLPCSVINFTIIFHSHREDIQESGQWSVHVPSQVAVARAVFRT
jgi:hypothetical protein